MRRNFAFMSNLTKEEMSLNDEQENTSETSFQVEFVADKLPQTKKDNEFVLGFVIVLEIYF